VLILSPSRRLKPQKKKTHKGPATRFGVDVVGTKHIDPDTGLIYFKYDFGYEFGLVLPGEPQKVDKLRSSIGQDGAIELPVLHELSASSKPDPTSTPSTESAYNPIKSNKAKLNTIVSFNIFFPFYEAWILLFW